MTMCTKRKNFRTLLLILLAVSFRKPCQAFSPTKSTGIRYRTNAKQLPQELPLTFGIRKGYSPQDLSRQRHIHLFQSKGNIQVDGTARGFALFSLVLAACVWLFSIPPEFRRAHFCFVEKCVEERSKCYDCVTMSEWMDGVTEYYQKGGGVQFDFTVAEETKALWKGTASK